MKYFTQKQTVCLEYAQIEKAKRFACDVVETVDYGDSNQFSKVKITDDHFVSKLGEEAVKKLFEKLGKKVRGPDYTVYFQKNKSWAADLQIEGQDLAVKTQKKSVARKYGLSWTFQSSAVRRDPILDNNEKWVCFVECDDTDASYPCTVYPPVQMKELIFKEPVLEHLKGKKQVVYAKDIEHYKLRIVC